MQLSTPEGGASRSMKTVGLTMHRILTGGTAQADRRDMQNFILRLTYRLLALSRKQAHKLMLGPDYAWLHHNPMPHWRIRVHRRTVSTGTKSFTAPNSLQA